MNIDDSDRVRLQKLIGMLGSSFPGERDNAVVKIQDLAQKYNFTITELMAQAHAVAAPPPRETAPVPADLSGSILTALKAAVDCPTLTEWEVDFAGDVSDRYERDYELSEKQIRRAEVIIKKAIRYFTRNP
jgi:hypothetical protein